MNLFSSKTPVEPEPAPQTLPQRFFSGTMSRKAATIVAAGALTFGGIVGVTGSNGNNSTARADAATAQVSTLSMDLSAAQSELEDLRADNEALSDEVTQYREAEQKIAAAETAAKEAEEAEQKRAAEEAEAKKKAEAEVEAARVAAEVEAQRQADADAAAAAESNTPRGFVDAPASNVYYKNCTAARAAGAAPVRSGDPGYGKHLDRDGDGVGCE